MFDEFLQVPATRGELAELIQILRGQVGLGAAGIAAGGERDARENAVGVCRRWVHC